MVREKCRDGPMQAAYAFTLAMTMPDSTQQPAMR